jgi:tetratricopeptide (TPR) repeat protein
LVLTERRGRVATRPRLFFCLLALGAGASAENAAWCEQQWVAQEVFPKGYEAESPDANVYRWRAIAGKCQGTGYYEARLAFAYVGAGQYQKAREALAQIKLVDSRYAYLVDLVRIEIDAADLVDQPSPSSDAIVAIDERYSAHLNGSYSDATVEDSVDALIAYGSFKGAIGQFENGVTLLELAERIRKPARGKLALNRNLAVDYAALGRFDEAESAAARALQLSPIVMTSPQFMYALARSQASLGKRAEAAASMGKLAELRPDVAGSPEYAAANAFVRQKSRKPSRR